MSGTPAPPPLVTRGGEAVPPEPHPPRYGFPHPPITAGPAEPGRPESPLLDPRRGTFLQERTFSSRWLWGLGSGLMARPPLMELFQFWKVACASSPRQTVIYAVNSGLRVTAQSFQAPENLPGGPAPGQAPSGHCLRPPAPPRLPGPGPPQAPACSCAR